MRTITDDRFDDACFEEHEGFLLRRFVPIFLESEGELYPRDENKYSVTDFPAIHPKLCPGIVFGIQAKTHNSEPGRSEYVLNAATVQRYRNLETPLLIVTDTCKCQWWTTADQLGHIERFAVILHKFQMQTRDWPSWYEFLKLSMR